MENRDLNRNEKAEKTPDPTSLGTWRQGKKAADFAQGGAGPRKLGPWKKNQCQTKGDQRRYAAWFPLITAPQIRPNAIPQKTNAFAGLKGR